MKRIALIFLFAAAALGQTTPKAIFDKTGSYLKIKTTFGSWWAKPDSNFSAGSAAWGSIAGTISAQTDLWNMLGNKADLIGFMVPTNQLGSGLAGATVFLRGDQTWAAPGGGGSLWETDGNDLMPASTGTTDPAWEYDANLDIEPKL